MLEDLSLLVFNLQSFFFLLFLSLSMDDSRWEVYIGDRCVFLGVRLGILEKRLACFPSH